MKTTGKLLPACVATVMLSGLSALAQTPANASYLVDSDKVVNQIDVGIHGQFLEHIFNSVHGGLWGDMLKNGSLESKQNAPAPQYWSVYGDGSVTVVTENPLNSNDAQKLSCAKVGSEAGLQQAPLFLKKEEKYSGSLHIRSADKAAVVVVRVLDDAGAVVFEKKISDLSSEWKKYEFEFKAVKEAVKAIFQVGVAGKGEAVIDAVSLFSKSALDCGGFRPDLLAAIAEQKPTTIRYPGGSFASRYQWKDAIGPREKRTYYPNEIWDDRDPNQMGTDEFMLLCEKVGAEPILAINVRRGEKEALDWMEYCNGDVSTTWGKARAANGHPKPYHVKYWEIDNETWGMGPEGYAGYVTTFSKVMRAKDPSVKIIACGSYAYDDGPGQENHKDWNKRLLDKVAADFDYLSIHYYNGIGPQQDYIDDPRKFEAFMRDQVSALIKASANPAIRIYCSEWGMMNATWRAGLYTGGILNAFERNGNMVPMACPAVWLQTAPLQGDPRWPSSSILFDHRTWYPAPTYVVQKMWRDNWAPQRLAMEGPDKPVNAVATKSADGRTLYFKAVNVGKDAVDVEVKIAGGAKVHGAVLLLVAPGSEDARNNLDTPHAIWPKEIPVKVDQQTISFSMPALSVGVVKLKE